jgi:hypothetical protein
MELEPDFSRLSFDTSHHNQSEIEKQLGVRVTPRATYSPVFNSLWEPDMADQFFTTNPHHNSFLGIDPNLIDLSSFFDDDARRVSAAACSGVFSAQVDDGATNTFFSFNDQNVVVHKEEPELLPFQSKPRTYPIEKTPMYTPHTNTDHSLPFWPGTEFNNPNLSTPKDGFPLLNFNVCPDTTLPGGGNGASELSHPKMHDTLLEFDNILESSLPQHILDELSPIDSLRYTHHDRNHTTDSAASTLDGIAAPPAGGYVFENHEDMNDQNRCVRPDLLLLTPPYESPSPQSQHPQNQAAVNGEELLTTIDIDYSQVDVMSSRPMPTLDELTVNLDFNPKPSTSKRKRSSFTTAGKEKVRLVRDWGACVFCRSRKVSVSNFRCRNLNLT